jgi:hypothetical protein
MLVRIADALGVEISDLFGRAASQAAVDDQVAELLSVSGTLDVLSIYASLNSDSRFALAGFMGVSRRRKLRARRAFDQPRASSMRRRTAAAAPGSRSSLAGR